MLQLNKTSEIKDTHLDRLYPAESVLSIVLFGELSRFTSAFCENVGFFFDVLAGRIQLLAQG